MEIIKAEVSDHEVLTTITKKSKAYWGFSEDILNGWEQLLTITKDYIEKNNVFKLVQNDQIIGYYAYFTTDENTIKLDNIFVLPAFIGKGFGKILMHDFIKKVRTLGVYKITLDAEPNAEEFYKSFGFKTIGQLESSIKERYLPIMELQMEQHKLSYRIGTASDIERLKALGQLSYGQFKNVLTEDNWEKMSSFLSDINSYKNLLNIAQCFVCEAGDELVGMAFLVPKGNPTNIFDKEWSYIRMVGVDPKYSGLGIGQKLTQMCIDFAKVSNEKIIALHTSELMDKARYIYERLGFVQKKEIEPLFGKKYWIYTLEI